VLAGVREERGEVRAYDLVQDVTLLATMLRAATTFKVPWVVHVPRFRKPKVALFSRDCQWLRSDDEVRRLFSEIRDWDNRQFRLGTPPTRKSNPDHPSIIGASRKRRHAMASRPLLEERFVAPGALSAMGGFRADVVRKVEEAVRREPVVVVGMAQNPHVRKVRDALDEARVAYTYLEFGSYFSQWKDRLAIKLWSGWSTFPQVFVRGVLIGGEDLTKAALADGSLKTSTATETTVTATA
jgi:monothiol glutaredoxin